VLDKNKEIGKLNLVDVFKLKSLKSCDDIVKKCDGSKFYLGLYKHESTEICYKWIKEILDGLNKTEKKVYKKKKIPKSLKNKAWLNYTNKAEDYCACCRINKITMSNYSCGHIEAEVNGGELLIENLIPLCASCNSSMGTRNLFDFMSEYYSDNIKYIKKYKKCDL
jgi:hypothetical protein